MRSLNIKFQIALLMLVSLPASAQLPTNNITPAASAVMTNGSGAITSGSKFFSANSNALNSTAAPFAGNLSGPTNTLPFISEQPNVDTNVFAIPEAVAQGIVGYGSPFAAGTKRVTFLCVGDSQMVPCCSYWSFTKDAIQIFKSAYGDNGGGIPIYQSGAPCLSYPELTNQPGATSADTGLKFSVGMASLRSSSDIVSTPAPGGVDIMNSFPVLSNVAVNNVGFWYYSWPNGSNFNCWLTTNGVSTTVLTINSYSATTNVVYTNLNALLHGGSFTNIIFWAQGIGAGSGSNIIGLGGIQMTSTNTPGIADYYIAQGEDSLGHLMSYGPGIWQQFSAGLQPDYLIRVNHDYGEATTNQIGNYLTNMFLSMSGTNTSLWDVAPTPDVGDESDYFDRYVWMLWASNAMVSIGGHFIDMGQDFPDASIMFNQGYFQSNGGHPSQAGAMAVAVQFLHRARTLGYAAPVTYPFQDVQLNTATPNYGVSWAANVPEKTEIDLGSSVTSLTLFTSTAGYFNLTNTTARRTVLIYPCTNTLATGLAIPSTWLWTGPAITSITNTQIVRIDIDRVSSMVNSYLASGIVYNNASFSYDTNALSFFAAVVGGGDTLTPTQSNAVNNLCLALKADGTWNSIDALYPFVGTSTNGFSWNLINTTKYRISWSANANTTFTFNSSGVNFDGTNYGNSQFQPSTAGGNYSLNASFIWLYNKTSSVNGQMMGAVASSRINIEGRGGANVQLDGINNLLTGSPNFNTGGTVAGAWMALRVDANNQYMLFNNASPDGPVTSATSSLPAAQVYIGVSSGGYTPPPFLCAGAAIGGGFTLSAAQTFQTDMINFETALGRQ